MSTLSELVNSNQSWVADRAAVAIEIQDALKSGDLSADDAKELLDNLIDAEKLEEEATDVVVRATLVKAITEIAALAAKAI